LHLTKEHFFLFAKVVNIFQNLARLPHFFAISKLTNSIFLYYFLVSAVLPTTDNFVVGLSFYCRNILLDKPKRMLWQWSDEKKAR